MKTPRRLLSEPQDVDDEEMEELSCIPSAVSEPRWALHMCDSKSSKEGFKFYQLAAIVMEGGGAHTINQCKQCYNVMGLKRGEREVTAPRWREVIEEKALRGKLWAAFVMEQIARRMLEHFTIKKSVGQISLGRCGKRSYRRRLATGVQFWYLNMCWINVTLCILFEKMILSEISLNSRGLNWCQEVVTATTLLSWLMHIRVTMQTGMRLR